LIYGLQDWEFYSYISDLDFYYGYCGAFEGIDICIYDLSYYADDSDYEYLMACDDYYTCDSDGCTIYTNYEDYYYEVFGMTLTWEEIAGVAMDMNLCMYGFNYGKIACEASDDGTYAVCDMQVYYFEEYSYTPDGYYTDENGDYYYYYLYSPIANLVLGL